MDKKLNIINLKIKKLTVEVMEAKQKLQHLEQELRFYEQQRQNIRDEMENTHSFIQEQYVSGTGLDPERIQQFFVYLQEKEKLFLACEEVIVEKQNVLSEHQEAFLHLNHQKDTLERKHDSLIKTRKQTLEKREEQIVDELFTMSDSN